MAVLILLALLVCVIGLLIVLDIVLMHRTYRRLMDWSMRNENKGSEEESS